MYYVVVFVSSAFAFVFFLSFSIFSISLFLSLLCPFLKTVYLLATRFSPSMEMSRLTQDGAAEPVSRYQILRRERGQGNFHFPC